MSQGLIECARTSSRHTADDTRQHARQWRAPAVTCEVCHHSAVLEVDGWPDDTPVPAVRRRVQWRRVATRTSRTSAAADRVFRRVL
jgi:hypothetical protein